jgi:hypothetical protein
MKTLIYRGLSAAFCFALAVLLSCLSVVQAQYNCLPNGAPTTVNGGLTAADPTQALRIVRDGRPSSCVGKTNTLQAGSGAPNYDQFPFTNPTGQTACVTVDINATGCGVNGTTEFAAYLGSFNPANPAQNLIGDLGFSTTGTGSFSFSVPAGASFVVTANNIVGAPNTLCTSYSLTISYATNCRLAGYDATNDGLADLAVFRPSNGNWSVSNSAGGGILNFNLGVSTDIPVPGDYNGDGNTEVAIYRPSTGVWYTSTNPATNYGAQQWGTAGDIPVPGDYDRDSKTDLAVYRPSTGVWYILQSSNGTLMSVTWGTSGDIPYTGDFDGDRKYDFGLYRVNDPANPGNNVHYILESNFAQGFFLRVPFGAATDKVVPADYDGDGKTDIAVYRPSTGEWYINRSSITVGTAQQVVVFGAAGDIAQPADFDGDKKADEAVFRPSTGSWYWLRSSDNTVGFQSFGANGDAPVTSFNRTQ